MTSDLRDLLAAVVADPCDDTARLVYADCLEEHGNSARAEFIRVQVEAERLHPHSNARGALEARAQSLFAEHWVEWWGEVCAAIGLPDGATARYRPTGDVSLVLPTPRPPGPWFPTPHDPVTFRRGFPESVAVPALSAGPEPCGAYLARWSAVSPLTELVAVGAAQEPRYAWPEGEHLHTVRRLTLRELTTEALRAARSSSHLRALDDLTIRTAYQATASTRDHERAFARAHAGRLRRLAGQSAGEFIEWAAGAGPLTALESVQLLVVPPWPTGSVHQPLAGLAASSLSARVRELALCIFGSPDDLAPLLQSPGWGRLRRLAIDVFGTRAADRLDVFCRPDRLAGLEDLRLTARVLNPATVGHLAASPLLKRLKHFSLAGIYNDGRVLLPLADACDPERIETFAVRVPHFPERAANALRAKFGDRFRLLPA